MIFYLKKIISPIFFPLTITLILLLISNYLILFSKKNRLSKIFLTTLTAVFILFSYGIFIDPMIKSLERKYPPLLNIQENPLLKSAKWIVVLGGGVNDDPELPLTSKLSNASLTRLIEGIRIHNLLPDTTLLLSGGKVWNSLSEASLMKQLAIELGVNPTHIKTEEESKDSKDQARLIKKIIQKDKLILVTSAYHMNRVLLLFKHQKLDIIPAPTAHLISKQNSFFIGRLFPSPRKIIHAEKLIRESLGTIWAYLRGQI